MILIFLRLLLPIAKVLFRKFERVESLTCVSGYLSLPTLASLVSYCFWNIC
jgi:hypothetical protein